MKLMIYALIALAPLPLASARPAWQWLWVSVIGLMALVYLVRAWRQAPLSLPKPLSLMVLMVMLFVVWGFVQAVPLFGGIAAVSIPPVDRSLLDLGSISVDRQRTLVNTVFYAAHLVFFYLVFVLCTRRARAVQIIRFCGITVAVFAAYGFIVYVSGNDTVLWFEKWASAGSLTSTFVNRNSFAAFAGLGLQCLIAYAYFWIQDELVEGRTGRELYRHIIETMITKAWWLPLAIILTVIALLLANSRAGFGSAAVAVLVFVIIAPNAYQRSGGFARRLLGYGLVMAVAAGLFTLSGEVLEERLQADASFDQRFAAYPLILDAIFDRPLTGFGLGTFDDVFRLYRDDTVTVYFSRGHSDFLELAMTAGLPAAAMLVSVFIILVTFLIRHLGAGAQYRSFIALGITVSIQLGLHSLVDFSLQIPAVSYMWCAVLAASCAVADRCRKAAAVN